MPRRPRASTPVWLVTSPTERPASRAKCSATRRSSPVSVVPAGQVGHTVAGPPPSPVAATASGSPGAVEPGPTAALMRRRNSTTEPFPLGCTRLVMMITYRRLTGSSHIDGPVNPVWPAEPSGKKDPSVREYAEDMSQPSPRVVSPITWGMNIARTVDSFR